MLNDLAIRQRLAFSRWHPSRLPPPEAGIVRKGYNHLTGCIEVVFAHPSFPVCAPGSAPNFGGFVPREHQREE